MNTDPTPKAAAGWHPLDHIADASERYALAAVLVSRCDAILAQSRDEIARRADAPVCHPPTDLLPSALRAFVEFLRAGTLGAVDAAFSRAVESAGSPLTPFDAAACLRHAFGAVAQASFPTILAERGCPDDGHKSFALLMAVTDIGGAHLHSTLTQTVLRDMKAERERQMSVYQEVVRLATNDGLRLVEPDAMPTPTGGHHALTTPLDASRLRHTALSLAESTNMPPTRAEDFALAVGEAASNVLKHAGGGVGYAWVEEDAAYALLSDNGAGISLDLLPKALRPGWSSMTSLGMGFTLMMEMTDVLWLSTNANGTLICIQQNVAQPKDPMLHSLLLDDLAASL